MEPAMHVRLVLQAAGGRVMWLGNGSLRLNSRRGSCQAPATVGRPKPRPGCWGDLEIADWRLKVPTRAAAMEDEAIVEVGKGLDCSTARRSRRALQQKLE